MPYLLHVTLRSGEIVTLGPTQAHPLQIADEVAPTFTADRTVIIGDPDASGAASLAVLAPGEWSLLHVEEVLDQAEEVDVVRPEAAVPKVGHRVRVKPGPFYRSPSDLRPIPIHEGARYVGQTGLVTGEADREGDLAVSFDDYGLPRQRIAPDCLEVVA